jgi:cytochrome c-type biogenesis protein CcmH/NrfG
MGVEMTVLKTTTSTHWSNTQVFALAVVSLVLGVCGGLLIGKARANAAPQAVATTEQSASPSGSVLPVPAGLTSGAAPSAQELKQAADDQAAPLLEKLKSDPANASLLANLGNIYYDAKQYPAAIEYYERSLKSQPADTSVRTDLGTAFWYQGDADTAIAQFQKVLSYEPTKADTLFNLGIVEFQGKKDGKKAVAAWQKLLDTNPGYANKEKVVQLIAQAKN